MTRAHVLAVVLAVCAVCSATRARSQAPHDEGWQPFEGSWSASGERHELAADRGEVAAIIRLSGALVVKTGDELSRGFRAEAIGFDGGRAAGLGRAVWTDQHGDRIFSDLAGAPSHTGTQVTGTIMGGTGRYAGITGNYRFAWDYLLPSDEGRVQARAVAITGRYRRGPAR